MVQHACPLLVPLAEEGWTDDAVTVTIAERYLGELRQLDPDVDTLLLGCTHYPILKPALARAAERVFGRALTLVDSADAMSAGPPSSPMRRAVHRPGGLDCFVNDPRIAEVPVPRDDPGPSGRGPVTLHQRDAPFSSTARGLALRTTRTVAVPSTSAARCGVVVRHIESRGPALMNAKGRRPRAA